MSLLGRIRGDGNSRSPRQEVMIPPQERFVVGGSQSQHPQAYYDVAAEGIPLNHQGKTSWMLLGLRLFCRWISGQREERFRQHELQALMLERQYAREMEELRLRNEAMRIKYEAMTRRSEMRVRQQSAQMRQTLAEMLRGTAK